MSHLRDGRSLRAARYGRRMRRDCGPPALELGEGDQRWLSLATTTAEVVGVFPQVPQRAVHDPANFRLHSVNVLLLGR